MSDIQYYNLQISMPIFSKIGDSKTQALKVLEESSELVEATKKASTSVFIPFIDGFQRFNMCCEVIDVFQALGNFIECMKITEEELQDAYDAVFENNKERGRFDEGNKPSGDRTCGNHDDCCVRCCCH